MHTRVAHLILIAAHTCTFTGYFGLAFSLGGWFNLWNWCRRWNSSCTDVSSLYITSSKESLLLIHSCAHSSRFSLLGSGISWQQRVPWNVHPKSCLLLLMVERLTDIPPRLRMAVSCVAVVSSSDCILRMAASCEQ